MMERENSSILACVSVISALAAALNVYFANICSVGTAGTVVPEDLLHTNGQRYAHGVVRTDVQSSPSGRTCRTRRALQHEPLDALSMLDGGSGMARSV